MEIHSVIIASRRIDIRWKVRSRSIVTDDYVWIGTRAMVLYGIKINKGAIVAAGSVVTKRVGEKRSCSRSFCYDNQKTWRQF
jgi:acetyltransferase-like isoleucine patch superfamily enzyme